MGEPSDEIASEVFVRAHNVKAFDHDVHPQTQDFMSDLLYAARRTKCGVC